MNDWAAKWVGFFSGKKHQILLIFSCIIIKSETADLGESLNQLLTGLEDFDVTIPADMELDLRQAMNFIEDSSRSPILNRKFVPVNDDGNDADDDLTDEFLSASQDQKVAQFLRQIKAEHKDDDDDTDIDDEIDDDNNVQSFVDFFQLGGSKMPAEKDDAFALLPVELTLQDDPNQPSLEDMFKDKLLISPPLVCLRQPKKKSQ